MSFGSPRLPSLPTPPSGEEVAAYRTYAEAQRAVDHLADRDFPVRLVTIVGTDLRMVERITGRLTYSRVALAGAASGAWFGLFVGLVLGLFSTSGLATVLLPALFIGAAFGLLFGVVSYAATGGKRDFTSASQVVAGSYAVLCQGPEASRARALLAELPPMGA
jgi:hypothetical protein